MTLILGLGVRKESAERLVEAQPATRGKRRHTLLLRMITSQRAFRLPTSNQAFVVDKVAGPTQRTGATWSPSPRASESKSARRRLSPSGRPPRRRALRIRVGIAGSDAGRSGSG